MSILIFFFFLNVFIINLWNFASLQRFMTLTFHNSIIGLNFFLHWSINLRWNQYQMHTLSWFWIGYLLDQHFDRSWLEKVHYTTRGIKCFSFWGQHNFCTTCNSLHNNNESTRELKDQEDYTEMFRVCMLLIQERTSSFGMAIDCN